MSICAISTSWRASQINDARGLVDTMKKIGLNSLELEFRINSESFKEIKKNYNAWGVKIVSMHAVCPAPAGKINGAEQFFISDEDEGNRKLGVNHIKQTLRNASEIGAQAVIIHCGCVPIDEPINIMKKFYDEGKINSTEAKTALQKMTYIRTGHKKKSFQSLLKSLDDINKEAEKTGIDVGLENRYYFCEFPNIAELQDIFSRFNGSKLAYWHDTGHAHVNEVLFGVSHESLLKVFHDQLVGVHLHDVLDGYCDHNEPGCGKMDFDMIKSYLKPGTIRVMEINQRVNLAGAKQGIVFLRNKGLF